jgi:hypothetical protein
MGSIGAVAGALFRNEEIMKKLRGASQTTGAERQTAMIDTASSMAEQMGIPRANQTVSFSGPSLGSQQPSASTGTGAMSSKPKQVRRGRGGLGGTILGSYGLVAGK